MTPESSAKRAPKTRVGPQSPRFIVIEGPLRVGKTTLAKILAEKLHARRVYDCEDNPFLAEFYKEEPGSALRAQMYFLIERQKRRIGCLMLWPTVALLLHQLHGLGLRDVRAVSAAASDIHRRVTGELYRIADDFSAGHG